TPTFTDTPTPSPTPTVTSTPSSALQVVQIFDPRGEMVRQLTGTLLFADPDRLTMTLSGFTPAPSGQGGSVTISLDGQVVAVWDGLDSLDHPVPNGVYQVLVEEKAGGESYFYSQNLSVEELSRPVGSSLTAWPNLAHEGDTIRFTAQIAGQPAQAPALLRIYSLSGELVRTIGFSGGQALWNLDNAGNRSVASGLYIALLAGQDAFGRPVHQSLRVMVIR
ncbi:MAG TPA: hypothetical protein VFR02_02890, partial [bacterium]|nr:hypothetical protein [bacterium]